MLSQLCDLKVVFIHNVLSQQNNLDTFWFPINNHMALVTGNFIYFKYLASQN